MPTVPVDDSNPARYVPFFGSMALDDSDITAISLDELQFAALLLAAPKFAAILWSSAGQA